MGGWRRKGIKYCLVDLIYKCRIYLSIEIFVYLQKSSIYPLFTKFPDHRSLHISLTHSRSLFLYIYKKLLSSFDHLLQDRHYSSHALDRRLTSLVNNIVHILVNTHNAIRKCQRSTCARCWWDSDWLLYLRVGYGRVCGGGGWEQDLLIHVSRINVIVSVIR